MAGVSIALLLVGIVLGGGLIMLLSKRQKMPKMELFNMNYTESKNENNINNWNKYHSSQKQHFFPFSNKEGEALRCNIGLTFYKKIMLDIE